jgi:hypothetical protein
MWTYGTSVCEWCGVNGTGGPGHRVDSTRFCECRFENAVMVSCGSGDKRPSTFTFRLQNYLSVRFRLNLVLSGLILEIVQRSSFVLYPNFLMSALCGRHCNINSIFSKNG